jgi:cytidine deaminase
LTKISFYSIEYIDNIYINVGEKSKMEVFDITEQDKELIESALEVLKKNFDDGVYNHTVGCALRCKNGNIFLGVNCDGIHGSCAEFIAIGAAITAGEREFDTIVSVHDKAQNYLLPPCGNCRQMLIEYCPDINVILNDKNGYMIKVKIKDLLPLPYTHIIC